jgi:hypothetical protein
MSAPKVDIRWEPDMHKCDVDGCPRNTHLVHLNDRWLCFMHSEATGRGPDTVAPEADQRATDELKKTDGLD